MSGKKAFCEECRDEVPFTITQKQMEGTIKGEKYSYLGKYACCLTCDSEIYTDDINDFNLKTLYDVYREKNDIVPYEIVIDIPKKYAIGKRPISLLLGWGEQTFSRFCEGDIPTKQYSDILKRIDTEPNYYAELLERNKENLKTELSYHKSKCAVEALLGNIENEKTKIDLVIEYLLSRCEDITPLALQKALYYIQGFYYAFNQTFLFQEECEAWVHGPVYRDIYMRYRDYRFDSIDRNDAFDDTVFTSSEKEVLDSVVQNICCYSGKILERFTHMEAPWLETRGELSEQMGSDRTMQKEGIANYFSIVKDKYNMRNPRDIKVYTQMLFEKV